MRALVRTGPNKDLGFDPEHPEPTPEQSPSHYILRTKAVALTREELEWPEPKALEIPCPGHDVAAVVISAPLTPGPHAYKSGDEVYGFTFPFSGKGNAREITVADEREIALKPKNLSWEEAASVPLSALTAWQALFTHAKLQAPGQEKNHGKRVLVTAASGGVGIWGVQLAKLAGAEVVGTCGPSNVEYVKILGADTVLDYRRTDLLEWVNEDRSSRAFDVVLDCIGGQTLTKAWQCVRERGWMISVAEPADLKKPETGLAEGLQSLWFIVEGNREQLTKLKALIEEGQCQVAIDSVFQLEQYKEAFERLEGGHARGKVILKI